MNRYTIEIVLDVEDFGRDISGQLEYWLPSRFDSPINTCGIERATNVVSTTVQRNEDACESYPV